MARPRSNPHRGEARRRKREQVRRCYQEHTPPQVRRMRQQGWMDRINPEPQDVPWELPTHDCTGCNIRFGKAGQLRAYARKCKVDGCPCKPNG